MTQPLTPPVTRLTRVTLALRKHWALVLLLAVSFGYTGAVTALHTEAFSPIDEWVYVDYLYKMPEQGIVHEGEYAGEETLEILACDGTSPFGPAGPPCGSDYEADTSEFPNGGLTTASPYTPIHFAITRVLGDAIHVVTGIDELTSWRLTGSLWLAAGIFVLYLLMRKWGVRNHAIAALGLAFIASPYVWWTYTYVSTDASAFLVGALLLYLSSEYIRGARSGWWLVLISVVGVLIKVTNILGLWMMGLYLVITFIRELRSTQWTGLRTRRPDHPERYSLALLGIPALSLVIAGVTEFVWLRLVQLWAVSDLRVDQGVSIPLGPQEFLQQFTNFLPGALVSSPIGSYVPGFVYTPLMWITVAGVLGAFWLLRSKDATSTTVITVTIAAATFAPLLALTLQIVTSSYFALPARYGGPIVPGFLLLAGLLMRNRVGSLFVGGYGVALLAVGVWLSGYLATIA